MMERWPEFKKIYNILIAVVFLFAAMFLIPGAVYSDEPSLDQQVADAVSGGQLFLFNHFHDQGETGYYWDSSYNGSNDSYEIAATAAAVAALIETGKYSDTAYKAQIDKAIKYIQSFKQGNGGIYPYNATWASTYCNGMSLVALSLYHSVNPQPESFKTDYIQPSVNYFLNGQATTGGWFYYPNPGSSSSADLSNTQFGAMGLWYAHHYVLNQQFPTDVEESWADKLEAYVRNIQKANGCFGYDLDDDYWYIAAPMNGAGLWTLAMLGIDKTDQAVIDSMEWFNSKYTWDYTAGYSVDEKFSYYYATYAMAKGLAGMIPADYKFAASEDPWVMDLKQAMVANKLTTGTEGEFFWYSSGGHDPGSIIATTWVLMSLGFADPNTPSPTKRLPDPETADYPIKGQGFVILETAADTGVTISGAKRGNIDLANKAEKVKLPIGAFDFTLNGVPVGGSTVLKIVPPAGALDPTKPGFLDADGTIKDGLRWFKIRNGEWKNLPAGTVPIRLMPEGGPYTYIEVTLTDGGPEDDDGEANGTIVDPGAPGTGGEDPTAELSDPDSADYPITGPVTLEAVDNGVTIASGATRGNVAQGTMAVEVALPIGAFSFTLNGVTNKAVVNITPPAGALDPNNPDSFFNADGSIKDGLRWFMVSNGEWENLPADTVPISLRQEGYIEVTLTDGGPEDADGQVNGVIVISGAPGTGGADPVMVLADMLNPDYPIAGGVTLEALNGVTISDSAKRGNIAQATKSALIGLPIGAFDFTLNGVAIGGEAILNIIPPAGALNANNPEGFLNADGTVKDGFGWFKISNGEWENLAADTVSIRLMPVGGPYTHIEVTLTDGGPEDADGQANGIIVDPGAPGTEEVVVEPSDNADTKKPNDGSPCFINTIDL